MRKDVLISLLAITGAPVAALADADVVIDKTAWTGDDLTVSEDGSVTVSTGKEVSIEKELAPGEYKLQPATFTRLSLSIRARSMPPASLLLSMVTRQRK